MKLRKEYIIIFIIMVTEILGFSLILPFLPFYATKFGASPFVVGLIFMSFSLFQFISAPIMGKISDSFGRRPLLMFAQFSTFISYLILANANALWMIFLSRIVDGLLGSNMTIAQAYISDISTKENRSKAFGFMGAAFGFGFLVGPGVGGYLAEFSFSLPAYLAALVSFSTIILTYFFLPETIHKKKNVKLNKNMFHLEDFTKYLTNQKTTAKMIELFAFVLTHAIFVTTFALYAEKQINFRSKEVGFLLTYVGVISIFLRTIILSKLIDMFGDKKLQYAGTILVLSSMLALPFVNIPWHFIVSITLFAIGSGISRPVITSAISKSVSEKEQGAVMGVTSSLQSFSQIIGPLIGGFMLQNFFPGSFGLFAAGVMLIGLLSLIRTDLIKVKN